jgi:hypothetical protein
MMMTLNPGGRRSLKPPAKPIPSLADYRIVSDVSLAALLDRLAAKTDGMLMLSPDLADWFSRSTRSERDLMQLDAIWSGKPLFRDGARKSTLIERPYVSIAGRIRFDALGRALRPDGQQDSPLSRVLVAMPPPMQKNLQSTDAGMNLASETRFAELFDKLWPMDSSRDACDRPIPIELGLSPEAHEAWIWVCESLRAEQAGTPAIWPAFANVCNHTWSGSR